MGNKKDGLIHIQGWLNPDIQEDQEAIRAYKTLVAQGCSGRIAISKGLKAWQEKKDGGYMIEAQDSEMTMLVNIYEMMKGIRSTIANMKVGHVVTQQEADSISDMSTMMDEDTINNMISHAEVYNPDDDDEEDGWT